MNKTWGMDRLERINNGMEQYDADDCISASEIKQNEHLISQAAQLKTKYPYIHATGCELFPMSVEEYKENRKKYGEEPLINANGSGIYAFDDFFKEKGREDYFEAIKMLVAVTSEGEIV